jgi:RNA polymerase sigma-70 factor (ECF subfamily)
LISVNIVTSSPRLDNRKSAPISMPSNQAESKFAPLRCQPAKIAKIAFGIILRWLLAFAGETDMPDCVLMEPSDAELIAAVLQGQTASFEPLVKRYQPRIFATARRYARRESEVEDIVQEIFIKAFQKLASYRAEAPFEHWLMRLAVRTCYDFLRGHQRNRETAFTDISVRETDWLEQFVIEPSTNRENAAAARQLVEKVLQQLSPAARLVITLLEIEERSVKEISALTGWSIPLVKVRAFRARAEMRKYLERIVREKYM